MDHIAPLRPRFTYCLVPVTAVIDGEERPAMVLGYAGERVTVQWSEGPGMNHMTVVDASAITERRE